MLYIHGVYILCHDNIFYGKYYFLSIVDEELMKIVVDDLDKSVNN